MRVLCGQEFKWGEQQQLRKSGGVGACKLLELLRPIASQHTVFLRHVVNSGLYGCQEEEAGTRYCCECQELLREVH